MMTKSAMSARVHSNSVTEKFTQSFKGNLVESHNSSSIGGGRRGRQSASLPFTSPLLLLNRFSPVRLCATQGSSPSGSSVHGIL